MCSCHCSSFLVLPQQFSSAKIYLTFRVPFRLSWYSKSHRTFSNLNHSEMKILKFRIFQNVALFFFPVCDYLPTLFKSRLALVTVFCDRTYISVIHIFPFPLNLHAFNRSLFFWHAGENLFFEIVSTPLDGHETIFILPTYIDFRIFSKKTENVKIELKFWGIVSKKTRLVSNWTIELTIFRIFGFLTSFTRFVTQLPP